MKNKTEIFPLAFGTGRLPEIELHKKKIPDQDVIDQMIQYAVDNGINYFDTAPLYCNSQCEQAVGRALHSFRDCIYLGGKLSADDIKTDHCREALMKTLKNLQTDYLDYYLFWGINQYFFDEVIVKKKVLDQMRIFQQEGLIHKIAFSFHGDANGLSYIIDEAQKRGVKFDACLMQYNLLDRSNEKSMAYSHSLGVKTMIMGPAAGGRLAIPSDLFKKVHNTNVSSTYELALRFVLSNPNADIVLSGMSNMNMVKENIKIAKSSEILNWKKVKEALAEIESFRELYCTGCKYCQPCPAEIQIQDIFKCYTIFRVYDLASYAKGAYERYKKAGGKTFQDCLMYGQCEKKCPQGLSIRKWLKKVDDIMNEIQDSFCFSEHEHEEIF